MSEVASELLARAFVEERALPIPEVTWTSARLGPALIDIEDKAAVRRALEGEP